MSHCFPDTSERATAAAGSRFALVGAIVKRSHQLIEGWPPLVTNADRDMPAMTALREIAAGAVEVGQHVKRPEILHDEEAA